MQDKDIETMLDDINKCKELKQIEYLFYKKDIINDRNMYKEYKEAKETHNYKDFMESAYEFAKAEENNVNLAILSKYYELYRYADKGELLEYLTANLDELYNSMNQSGITDALIYEHNNMCENLNIDFFKADKNQMAVEFDNKRNSRDKLPILFLKNSFWLNEYASVLKKLFLQKNLEECIEGEFVDNSELNYLLYMNSKKNEILEKIYMDEVCSNPNEEGISEICKKYGEDYKNTFKDIFPNADMYKDYMNICQYETIIENIGQKRNVFLNILLKNQAIELKEHNLNPAIKQWGICNENQTCVLTFEPEGYMVPVTFYVPQHVYSDFKSSLPDKNCTLPELPPLKEFNSDNDFNTSVLVKPTAEQLKQIKLMSKQKNKQGNFFQRVFEQINGRTHLHMIER